MGSPAYNLIAQLVMKYTKNIINKLNPNIITLQNQNKTSPPILTRSIFIFHHHFKGKIS